MAKPTPKKRNFKKPYVPEKGKTFTTPTGTSKERKRALRVAKYEMMAGLIMSKTKPKKGVGIKEIAAELAYQDFKAGKD